MNDDVVIRQPWNGPMTRQTISDIAAKMTAGGPSVLRRGERDTVVVSADAAGAGDVLVRTSSIPKDEPAKFRLMLMYEIGFRWFITLPSGEADAKIATAKAISKIEHDMVEA